MKLLTTLLAIIFSFNAYSQNNIYNTKIEKAIKVEIKEGVAEIKNVENLTISTVIISDTKPRYYFAGLFRQKDSLGIYTTQINLKHSGNPENIYVNIALEFDEPVNSVGFKKIISMGSQITFSGDKKMYAFKGFVLAPEKIINIIVKSTTPVFIKLHGVDVSQN